jgi:hypothetical protein
VLRPLGARGSRSEDQEALAVEDLVVLGEAVAGLLHLLGDGGLAGVMTEASGEPAAGPVELDDGHAAVRGEVAQHAFEVVGAILDVVIGVAGEQQVDLAVGELGVVEGGQHRLDVVAPLAGGAFSQVCDHGFVDVHGVDPAGVSDRIREAEGEVPTSGAEVRDAAALPDVEQGYDLVGLLPVVAADALVETALDAAAAETERHAEQGPGARSHRDPPSSSGRAIRSCSCGQPSARAMAWYT